ncbi:RNase A-like domain-containing protein [Paraburkholderia sp. HP33-1]|uniref:RNase A-like domain-containing protein n=1 Tax=Paraburkholderia sp. HP33-1 TaxID=2883243 RepID=UPI001F223E5D|nr:RNase A-like domain-containing protein [Paraburkholderia sp. HP33-1]
MSYPQDSDGVRVVLSAPQLAAVLTRQSISHTEMLSNRLWGGLQLVGGLLEMVGAGALCVLPEPTMASKAGCIVFGAHGSDTAAAGLRQVWTGRDTATLTQQGTTKLAEAMKASPDMANNIGLSLDMVVPFGFAGSIKAARAARITMGRINLHMHEAKALNPELGGHTILKHVGKDEAWLRDRLKREPKRKVVSSFTSLEKAERAISETMRANTAKIRAWARSPNRYATEKITKVVAGDIGYGVTRETGKLTRMNKVFVVLKYETYNGMPYYVLTAYLE